MGDPDLKQLQEELTKIKALEVSKATLEEDLIEAQTALDKLQEAKTGVHPQTIYVKQPRGIDRFRDRPEKASDLTVEEWVSDVKSHLKNVNWTKKDQAAFIIQHLAAKARREIQGRGDDVCQNPEKIYECLTKIFGDGDTFPQLQQCFFSYQQKEKEDLLSCSLELVELFDCVAELDPTFKPTRDVTLKRRFAEVVRDEGLKRELRRLNMESPSLTFFELRDRAIQWMGNICSKQKLKACDVMAQEVTTEDTVLSVLKAQGELLAQQQKQMQTMLELMQGHSFHEKGSMPGHSFHEKGSRRPPPRNNSRVRRCWTCNSVDHLQSKCPQNKKSTPAFSSGTQQGN